MGFSLVYSGSRCCPLVTNLTTMFVDIVAMLHLLAAVFKQSLPFRFMKPLRSVVGGWSRLFTVNNLYLGEQSSKSRKQVSVILLKSK